MNSASSGQWPDVTISEELWAFASALGGLVLLPRRMAQGSFCSTPRLPGKAQPGGLARWVDSGWLTQMQGDLIRWGQFGAGHDKLILLPPQECQVPSSSLPLLSQPNH